MKDARIKDVVVVHIVKPLEETVILLYLILN